MATRREEIVKKAADLVWELALEKENILIYELDAIMEEVEELNYARFRKHITNDQ